VTDGRDDLDPRAPLFFLSYGSVKPLANPAAEQTDLNRNAIRLFHDLSVHVVELLGLPAGTDPGFMDQTFGGGEPWRAEILRAVGTCQVFIPLVSPLLIRSEWCAKEWHAFTRRNTTRLDGGTAQTRQTSVIPVIWTPSELANWPPVIRDIQVFAPNGLPDAAVLGRYRQEGLNGLLIMEREADYRTVVWKLARRVVQVLGEYRVRPRIPDKIDQLVNVFSRETL